MFVFQSMSIAQKTFEQQKIMTLDFATIHKNNIIGNENMGVQGICKDMLSKMNRL